MSRNLDSPVQTHMAVALVKGALSGDKYNGKSPPPGRRRIFVQTDNGSVLGLDLDRRDNAHTVKRRLQLELNVPTDEGSLTFGDLVLNNDLSAVRNNSPLLLTRNVMHRSSSTPCLSPTGKDLQQRVRSGPIEILGCSSRFVKLKELVVDVVEAMKIGVDPIRVNSGLGGAYYFRNSKGESVAIIKPTDEEPFAPNNPKGFVGKALGQPGLKKSVRVGETGFREVAAYLLDYDHFANVPQTALVKITHSIFNTNKGVSGKKSQEKKKVSKIASFQQFITHDYDASDHGTSSFPVGAVHRIGILDIRILNTDRHSGNLLVRKLDNVGRFGHVELTPIDHGLCLPESLEDPYFEWIHWPQASIPFFEDELEYIANLDPFKDSEMLREELPMIREACLRVLVLCTMFLKEAAVFGLCLSEIGDMMSREFSGREEGPSELEEICLEARRLLEERKEFMVLSCNCKAVGDQAHELCGEVHFEKSELGYLEANLSDYPLIKDKLLFSRRIGNGCNPFSKLYESIEEEVESECEKVPPDTQVPFVSKLSGLLKSCSLGEKQQWFQEVEPEKNYSTVSPSSGNRSAIEQLSDSTTFVKVAGMNEQEWILFLDILKKLLCSTFLSRKSGGFGQRQKPRLGTSCKF